MSKIALLAAFLIAGFSPTAFGEAQTKSQAASKAKKEACRADADAKNLKKAARKTFMADCIKK